METVFQYLVALKEWSFKANAWILHRLLFPSEGGDTREQWSISHHRHSPGVSLSVTDWGTTSYVSSDVMHHKCISSSQKGLIWIHQALICNFQLIGNGTEQKNELNVTIRKQPDKFRGWNFLQNWPSFFTCQQKTLKGIRHNVIKIRHSPGLDSDLPNKSKGHFLRSIRKIWLWT